MYFSPKDKMFSQLPIMTSNTFSCPPMEQSYSSNSQHSAQSSLDFSELFAMYGSDLEIPLGRSLDSVYEFSAPSSYPMSDVYPLSIPYIIPIPSYAASTASAASVTSSPYETQFAFTPSLEEGILSQYPFETNSPPSESPKPLKPYNCEDCGRAFTRAADLKRHQTSVHYPVYQDCPVANCSRKAGNGFPRRDHLIEHLRSYHHMDLPKRRTTKRVCKGHS